MKIIEPNVELITFTGNEIEHVAKCARVCYGKEKGNDEITYNNLINNKHWSMFRHTTEYFIIPRDKVPSFISIICNYNILFDLMYVGINVMLSKYYYVVINGNWKLDHPIEYNVLHKFKVSPDNFKDYETGFSMMRYTFKIITQISTSRELNRVSPNNISERSTRYVYEDGTICRPHWLKENITNSAYLESITNIFITYKNLIDNGMKRQDARGVLPLDTATQCIYTYSIDEWRHIIDLRSSNKAHPNARIIANMIKNELIKLGYEFKKKENE